MEFPRPRLPRTSPTAPSYWLESFILPPTILRLAAGINSLMAPHVNVDTQEITERTRRELLRLLESVL